MEDECSKLSTELPNLLEASGMGIKLVRLEQILRAYSVAGDSETHIRGIADCPQARFFCSGFFILRVKHGNRL